MTEFEGIESWICDLQQTVDSLEYQLVRGDHWFLDEVVDNVENMVGDDVEDMVESIVLLRALQYISEQARRCMSLRRYSNHSHLGDMSLWDKVVGLGNDMD